MRKVTPSKAKTWSVSVDLRNGIAWPPYRWRCLAASEFHRLDLWLSIHSSNTVERDADSCPVCTEPSGTFCGQWWSEAPFEDHSSTHSNWRREVRITNHAQTKRTDAWKNISTGWGWRMILCCRLGMFLNIVHCMPTNIFAHSSRAKSICYLFMYLSANHHARAT